MQMDYNCLNCDYTTTDINNMNDHIDQFHNENYGELKSPDEILDILDQAQAQLGTEQFDLRSLLWEVITDILNSIGDYSVWDFADSDPVAVVNECHAMLTDYVVHYYGD